MWIRTSRFVMGLTEGAAIAGAASGQVAMAGAITGVALSLTGAFTAVATGNSNILEVAQKCGYSAFLVSSGLMATWHGAQLIKDFLHERKDKARGLQNLCRLSYKAVATGELATFGVIGYLSEPTICSMVRTIVK